MFSKKSLIAAVLCVGLLSTAGCSNAVQTTPNPASQTQTATADAIQLKTKVLFINTSRDPQGNTAKMGEEFLKGVPHDTIFLNDYKIYQLGQNFPDDQLHTVLNAMEQADTIVIGTPVYWHTMSGPLKTFIDRLYTEQKPVKALAGKKLYFLMQGAAPSQTTIEHTPYIMSRVASQYDAQYMGAATGMNDMGALEQVLHNNL